MALYQLPITIDGKEFTVTKEEVDQFWADKWDKHDDLRKNDKKTIKRKFEYICALKLYDAGYLNDDILPSYEAKTKSKIIEIKKDAELNFKVSLYFLHFYFV